MRWLKGGGQEAQLRQVFVFVLIGAVVEEAEKSPGNLRIENEGDRSLEVYEQLAMIPTANALGSCSLVSWYYLSMYN